MDPLSDYELMQLIKSKRHDALALLYDRYSRLVYSYALQILKDETAARDIVQSVFIRIWTTGSDYHPDRGRFAGWLMTITRNLAIDWIRKESRGRAVPVEPERMRRVPDDQTPSPEDIAVSGALEAEIRRACRHLSDQQMLLLEHFYWQGYTLRELAAFYNQPLGTVKNRLHQALKILRKHLSAERNDSG